MSAPSSKSSSYTLEIVVFLIANKLQTTLFSAVLLLMEDLFFAHKFVRVLPLFSSKYNSSLFLLLVSHTLFVPGVVPRSSSTVLSHCSSFQKISTSLHSQYGRLFFPSYKDQIIRRSPLPFLCKRNCSSSVWTGQDMDRVPLFSLPTVDPFVSSLAS